MNQGKYIFAQLTDVIGNYKCIKSVNKNVSKFSKINFRFSDKYKKNVVQKIVFRLSIEKIFRRV